MEINEFYKERKKHLEEEIKRLQGNISDEKQRVDEETRIVEGKISELKESLSKLGFFKFQEKKSIQSFISTYEGQIGKLKADFDSLAYNSNIEIDKIKAQMAYINPKFGEIVKLGNEPFSDGGSQIEWKVVDNDGTTITLLSLHTLDSTSYYQADKWLKENFVKDFFSASEQELLCEKCAFLPTTGEISKYTSGKMGTTPTNSLRNKLTREAQNDGRRFGYTRLQIENSIKFQVENSHPYWLVTDSLRDGFANYVGQSMSYDWIVSKIGAGATFGVRAIVKIDNFKLSNYSN